MGCAKPSWGRGWCVAHYTRWRRNGDPLGGKASPDPDRKCRNHPDRKSVGRGLCGSCLRLDRLEHTQRRCENHPDVPEYAVGLCNSCYQARARIKRKYGLTNSQYLQHVESPCGICDSESTVIDHDHVTGEVRGGLCTRCNVGLGVVEGWYVKYRSSIDAWLAKPIDSQQISPLI